MLLQSECECTADLYPVRKCGDLPKGLLNNVARGEKSVDEYSEESISRLRVVIPLPPNRVAPTL